MKMVLKYVFWGLSVFLASEAGAVPHSFKELEQTNPFKKKEGPKIEEKEDELINGFIERLEKSSFSKIWGEDSLEDSLEGSSEKDWEKPAVISFNKELGAEKEDDFNNLSRWQDPCNQSVVIEDSVEHLDGSNWTLFLGLYGKFPPKGNICFGSSSPDFQIEIWSGRNLNELLKEIKLEESPITYFLNIRHGSENVLEYLNQRFDAFSSNPECGYYRITTQLVKIIPEQPYYCVDVNDRAGCYDLQPFFSEVDKGNLSVQEKETFLRNVLKALNDDFSLKVLSKLARKALESINRQKQVLPYDMENQTLPHNMENQIFSIADAFHVSYQNNINCGFIEMTLKEWEKFTQNKNSFREFNEKRLESMSIAEELSRSSSLNEIDQRAPFSWKLVYTAPEKKEAK